jgi:hypothetical protein
MVHTAASNFGAGASQEDITKYTSLAFKEAGVLFEDATVQVGCKCSFPSKAQAQLSIFVGNKTQASLSGASITVAAASDGVAVKPGPPVPESVAAGAQASLEVYFQCTAPYSLKDTPTAVVKFKHAGGTYEITLKLPLFVNKFVERPPGEFVFGIVVVNVGVLHLPGFGVLEFLWFSFFFLFYVQFQAMSPGLSSSASGRRSAPPHRSSKL